MVKNYTRTSVAWPWTVILKSMLLVCSSHSVKMQSQPTGVASGKDGLVVVACLKEVSVHCIPVILVIDRTSCRTIRLQN